MIMNNCNLFLNHTLNPASNAQTPCLCNEGYSFAWMLDFVILGGAWFGRVSGSSPDTLHIIYRVNRLIVQSLGDIGCNLSNKIERNKVMSDEALKVLSLYRPKSIQDGNQKFPALLPFVSGDTGKNQVKHTRTDSYSLQPLVIAKGGQVFVVKPQGRTA